MSDEQWQALSSGLADHLRRTSTPRTSGAAAIDEEEEGAIAPLT